MAIPKGQNPHHPKRGASTKVEPIRSKKAIDHIKKILKPRDRCLFILGINTAYRANELLSLRMRHVRWVEVGDVLDIKQSKTDQYRMASLNRSAVAALHEYVESAECQRRDDDEYLFQSQRSHVLRVPSVVNMVKRWCQDVGLKGNYGSHTLRKTWGYWQYKSGNAETLPRLMVAFGHASQKQTLDYLCIQAEDVKALFAMEL
ncbi:integrase family protein (plasmid) [Thalassoporum mexicanum PCC 7367]|uniref:site-specific integrase n=1 Tax=Thalassoporum mexicanum TaxID=3457544 RepID=UPI00029FCBEA|nr:site-specific integrase [Pseudanabaena sp. PCC 7367]AFY71929.1 integrase family protein [Pseudanabaena sp. PCC 7367]